MFIFLQYRLTKPVMRFFCDGYVWELEIES